MRIAARFTTRRTFAYSELIGAGRRLQYEAATGAGWIGAGQPHRAATLAAGARVERFDLR